MDAIPAVPRPRGFPDRVGTEVTAAEEAASAAIQTLTARGYTRIDTPIVERSELFLRRSGGVLASQMYEFTGPDGSRLSLRPEMTAPVIRYAIDQGDALELPARYQYCGPVFRYPDPTLTGSDRPSDALRQFTQLGAELLGDPSPEADAEIISAAIEAAQAMGCKDIEVRLGHVGAVRAVLGNLKLPQRARVLLAANLAALKGSDLTENFLETAARMGLVSDQSSTVPPPPVEPSEAVWSDDVDDLGDYEVGILDETARDFKEGLRIATKLASIEGDIGPTIESYRKFCKSEELAGEVELDTLLRLESSIDVTNTPPVRILLDLGIRATIGYYTGFTLQLAFIDPDGIRRVVGHGGRYDELATDLGSNEPVPALGFALNLRATSN